MTEAQSSDTQPEQKPKPGFPTQGAETQKPLIHRVCVTCNNMFQVTPERYEAKQCPACHKGG
jgi:hypothetical protein